MADFAIGVTACIAFWRNLAFKAAAVCAASIFLFGDAIGRVREMMVSQATLGRVMLVSHSTWTSYDLPWPFRF